MSNLCWDTRLHLVISGDMHSKMYMYKYNMYKFNPRKCSFQLFG